MFSVDSRLPCFLIMGILFAFAAAVSHCVSFNLSIVQAGQPSRYGTSDGALGLPALAVFFPRAVAQMV